MHSDYSHWKNTTILILAGGFGTRLASVFPNTSKSIVPFHGKPLIAWTIETLLENMATDIRIVTHHQHDQISQTLSAFFSQSFQFIKEEKPLGTGGSLIKNIEGFKENILVVNGDLYTEFNFQNFLSFCHQFKAHSSVVLHKSLTPLEADLVAINATTNFVEEFCLRPHSFTPAQKHWVNAGICYLNKSFLTKNISLFNFSKVLNLEKDILSKFPDVLGSRFLGFTTQEPIFDIGTPQKFQHAEKYLAQKF